MTHRYALYDLDKTVLRHASFTPFLIFAARRRSRLRVLLLPVWLLAMAGYKLGLYSRGALKQFGLQLMVGRLANDAQARALGRAFAGQILPDWIAPGAATAIEADRKAGCELWLVTAAMGFYAEEIGRRLAFDRVIATGHALTGEGRLLLRGDNCYGAAKVARMEEALEVDGVQRSESAVAFYSDSASDAPLFDWADRAVLVNGSASARRKAARHGWETTSFY